MKKIYAFLFVLCLMALTCVEVNAQFFKGFVSLGGTVSQIDGDEVYGYNKTGLTAGVGAMLPFVADKPNEGFQVSLEINYAQRGAKETKWGDPFRYNASLQYIDIPLMLNYVDKKGGITLSLGMQYGRLIKSNEEWDLPEDPILGMERPLTTDSKFLKNDWAVVGGLRFTLWQRIKLDARYQYSLAPIRKDFGFSNSFGADDNANYRTWTRNFKSNWFTVKLIYVINEEIEQKVAPKRKTAF